MMSKIYVVNSGMPSGEINDREVYIIKADSEEQALQIANIQKDTCHGEWLWGPHAREQSSFSEAVRFAAYRAGDIRNVEVLGFEDNRETRVMVDAVAGWL